MPLTRANLQACLSVVNVAYQLFTRADWQNKG